jgi:hypothetical protein
LQLSKKTIIMFLLVRLHSSSLLRISTSRESPIPCVAVAFVDEILFRETKQKTLEDIAAAFGDKVVLVDERAIAAEEVVLEEKARLEEVEMNSRAVK